MIVGIDLGTTNSLIGVYGGSGLQLIRNALGDYLTPSAVSIGEDGSVLVGRAARDRLVSHPDRSVGSFKRWMGARRDTVLGGRTYLPEELSALVIRALLDDAEAALGVRPEEAVISVPAYFSDSQRRATKRAGELAGIRVERLINEPTAAALAYGLAEKLDDAFVMVLDLGGGTFDVSILEIFSGVVKVHASAGDNYLGGDDFTAALEMAWIRRHGINREAMRSGELAQLRRRAEVAKLALSGGQAIALIATVAGREYTLEVDEATFEEMIAPLVQRMRQPIERALRDAGLRGTDLADVVMVGGASRMPQLAKLAARLLGRLPLRHVAPDEAVAQGACVAAGLKARNIALEEIVLTDVCPHSLGVEVSIEIGNGQHSTGQFDPIIERNSTVPVSRMRAYYPVGSRQEQLTLNVFQGESPVTRNNILLGSLNIPITPGAPAENGVDVRFTYDINGVLQVEAKVQKTGIVRELILMQAGSQISEAEARQRMAELAALKVHPRDEQRNIAALSRIERLYAESLGEQRPWLQEMLLQFQAVLGMQDPKRVEEHRHALSAALDDFEEGRSQ